jgi:hypothetical protein
MKSTMGRMSRNTKSLVRKPDGRDTLGNLGINERIILKCILRKQGVDRIQLAQDRVQWWAFVNTVTNIWIL